MEQALLHEGHLAQTLDSFLRWLLSSDRIVGAVRLRSNYTRTVTDEVLAAIDLEDLTERLDVLGSDSEFWNQETAGTNTGIENIQAQLKAAQPDIPSLTATLGLTATHRCEQGWNAFKTVVLRVQRLVAVLGSLPSNPLPKAVTTSQKHGHLIDYAYDLSLPASLRHGVALMLRSVASAFAIARAEEHGEKVSPWLALGLANNWSEAPERLAAMLGDSEALIAWIVSVVPEAVAVEKLRSVVEAWKQEAVGAGHGVYFPLDPDPGSAAN